MRIRRYRQAPVLFLQKPINTIPMKSVLFKHRSIRKFRSTPIPEDVLHEILEAASRASTCGNMQLYSLVVTRDAALRGRLAPCHFNQPMVTQAPCVVTVCADVHRFSMWCGSAMPIRPMTISRGSSMPRPMPCSLPRTCASRLN